MYLLLYLRLIVISFLNIFKTGVRPIQTTILKSVFEYL